MGWTLITGAAKRLGAEIAEVLASKGYDLVLHYRNSLQEAELVASRCRRMGVRAELIYGDFSTVKAILDFTRRYLERFPETQNLVNNVGNYLVKSTLETSDAEWDDLFQTNLRAPFILSREIIPSLVASRGAIVNLGNAGIERRSAGIYAPVYHLAKSGLLLLTRTLALELAPQQVRVNMVSPGHLDISVDLPFDLGKIPMKRPAKTEEVARVVAFLLDPASGYITGQNIEVSGGYCLS